MPVADPDPIAQLIAGRYADPETGELLRAESRSFTMGRKLVGIAPHIVSSLDIGRHVAVLSDTITHPILGARIERELSAGFTVQSIVLDHPRADSATVDRIVAGLAPGASAIIAVGSGTLNDLGKMVAFQRDIPQVVFATAPSMNGYTSLSASITTDGVKRSYRTRTPVAVVFDLDILAAAPPRLIRAGLGDSSCRATAQADWLLSHLVLDRPYREVPFALLAADEAALRGQTRALLAGNTEAMCHLVRILVLSGFGMTICNGSYPASQGEHLVSHYIEMTGRDLPHAFHGEQIGVTTVAMARLQDRLLASDAPPVLRPSRVTREHVIAHFGEIVGDACWQELQLKQFDRAQTDALNARLASSWDAIRARIARVTPGAAVLAHELTEAGAATEPEGLGWSPSYFAEAMQHAREIRNRYTFLDLAADAQLSR